MWTANITPIRDWAFDAEHRDRMHILGRVLLANTPAILLSLFLPAYFVAAMVLAMSWRFFYPLTNPFQPQLFTLQLKRCFLQIAIPMLVIQVGWMFLLLSLHRQSQLAAAQMPMLLLTGCAIAPLYRSPKSTRTQRLMSYKWIYLCGASVVFISETMLLWRLA